jgi:hypothetical protein
MARMQNKRCKRVHIFTKSGDPVECAKTVQFGRRPLRQSVCVFEMLMYWFAYTSPKVQS